MCNYRSRSHRHSGEAEASLRPRDHPVAEEALANASEHDLRNHQGRQELGLPAVHLHGEGAAHCHQASSQRRFGQTHSGKILNIWLIIHFCSFLWFLTIINSNF